jgi:tetratricopeptide (TPR) repeat protein
VYWLRPAWLPFSRPAPAFSERDWILIADVENLTGDRVFDRSLGAALDVGIAQSRYVNVFPRDRLQAALQRARKPRDAPLDAALAAEVAVREGVRAVLVCSIAQVGTAYSLTAGVIDPRTQATIVSESVEANGRERVLDALNDLAAHVRRALGESTGALSEQGVALPLATSASLDALKMYADALRLGAGEEGTGEELLRQAIAADPDFAVAHASLGARYLLSSNRETRTEGERSIARALALSNRLTSRERLWIQAAADDARGNREQAVIGYKAYLAQYPDDTRAWFRLGSTLMTGLSQYDAAAAAFKRVTDIDPNNSSAWINLASCYGGLRQHDQAVATYDRTFALAPEFLTGQYVNGEYGSALVHVGRIEDARQAFERMTAAPDALRRARGRRSMAFLLMHLGQYRAAAAELRQAIQLNEANNFLPSAFRDRVILAQALLALGGRDEALRELAAADQLIAKLSPEPEWLSRMAKIRARLGQVGDAQRMADRIADAIGNAVADSSANRNVAADQGHLDLARGEIELALGRPGQAAALVAAAATRLAPVSVLESQAEALLASGQREEAALRYEQLLALAYFGGEEQEDGVRAFVALGGIYEKLGRADAARALYERLVAQWADGDEDLLLLKQARARLKTR